MVVKDARNLVEPGVHSCSLRTCEDEVWTQFCSGTTADWSLRCAACREGVLGTGRPVELCVNCWKVELWGCSPLLSEPMDGYALCDLAEALAVGEGCLVKVSKGPIPVVRSGVPVGGYPETGSDHLLMAYAESIGERDAVRAALCSILGSDPESASQIPVRRGCWIYDDILGPWGDWYAVGQDMVGV